MDDHVLGSFPGICPVSLIEAVFDTYRMKRDVELSDGQVSFKQIYRHTSLHSPLMSAALSRQLNKTLSGLATSILHYTYMHKKIYISSLRPIRHIPALIATTRNKEQIRVRELCSSKDTYRERVEK